MENDFSVEEMLDMPTEGEVQNEPTLTNTVCKVQMNMANTDSVGQDDLCKVVSTPTGAQSQTGDYKEPDYIDTDNESHGGEIPCELFCVTGKDSDYIDIEDLY